MAHQGAPPQGGRVKGAEEPQGLATRPGGRRRPLVTDLREPHTSVFSQKQGPVGIYPKGPF